MSKSVFKIVILPCFRKQLKTLVKRYASLKDSVIEVLKAFHQTQHISLGNNIYKIRLTTKDISKGKSSAFRLFVFEKKNLLVPFVIYFKGDRQNISRKQMNDVLARVLYELEEEV